MRLCAHVWLVQGDYAQICIKNNRLKTKVKETIGWEEQGERTVDLVFCSLNTIGTTRDSTRSQPPRFWNKIVEPVCRYWAVCGPLRVRSFAYLRAWAGKVLPHANVTGWARCRRSSCSGCVGQGEGEAGAEAQAAAQEKGACRVCGSSEGASSARCTWRCYSTDSGFLETAEGRANSWQ